MPVSATDQVSASVSASTAAVAATAPAKPNEGPVSVMRFRVQGIMAPTSKGFWASGFPRSKSANKR